MDCIYETYDAEGKHCGRPGFGQGVGNRCHIDYAQYCPWYIPEKPSVIDKFDGNYSFLSNFYECEVWFDGLCYKNSEAAFQSAKTKDKKLRKVFTELNPSNAKYLGRHIELRDDWEQVKDDTMYEIVLKKFQYNIELKELLLETDNLELIEGNTWNDTYWGVCNGVGQNKLGKILMQVREGLK